jgi:hypothetical protein
VRRVKLVSRVAAGLAALATLPFVLFGLFWIWLMYDWAGERADVLWMLFLAGATGTIMALGLAAGSYAVLDRAAHWRRLAMIPAGAVVVVAILTEPWWTA